ncbi:hypothetical protein ILYODFUR_010934 [Ilyodon furcidens]|uniref:Secreted protein n=1 Tax=Ilyodon furcidens TaxID=33524 RepID=A0ABV0TIW3_9TELE
MPVSPCFQFFMLILSTEQLTQTDSHRTAVILSTYTFIIHWGALELPRSRLKIARQSLCSLGCTKDTTKRTAHPVPWAQHVFLSAGVLQVNLNRWYY